MRALDQLECDVALRATTELPQPTAAELLPPALLVRRQNDLPFFLEIVRAAPAAPGQWQRLQWRRGDTLYRATGPASASLPAPNAAAARLAVLDAVSVFQSQAWEPDQGWRNLPGLAPARATAMGLELGLGVKNRGDGAVQTCRRVFVFDRTRGDRGHEASL